MSAYCTDDDLKGEGIKIGSGGVSSTRITELIAYASQYIDVETSRWFYKRDFSAEAPFLMDGSGTRYLHLKVPIISVTSITVDDELVDPDEYVVYSRIPDDRENPKIVRELSTLASVFCSGNVQAFPLTECRGPVWTKGRLNVAIVGSLGYVDLSGASYIAPLVVKRIAMRLVIRELEPMLNAGADALDAMKRSRLLSETTDQHSYTLSALAVSGGLTGDPEIDGPLGRLRAPAYCRGR